MSEQYKENINAGRIGMEEKNYQEEILKLQGEVENLKNELKQNAITMREITQIISSYADVIEGLLEKNELYRIKIDNLPYEIADGVKKDMYWIPEIMTVEETIDAIVNEHKSICRFGDGEIGIIYNIQRWKFQGCDFKLSERLREVILSNDENIMIGINDFYGNLSHRSEEDRDPIRRYIIPEVREQHYALLQRNRVYANARMSRNWTMEMALNQKRIWEGKECVFIEGDKTRMGVGNDLFDNAMSIERILCPSENAFDRYEEIFAEAVKMPRNKLFLIALGPTASVLAYDLAKAGYQAIDLGHADLSYEWLKKNNGKKTAVTNKYNNEYPDGDIVEDIVDKEYESQIIADFS